MNKPFFPRHSRISVHSNTLILAVSLFILLFTNFRFATNILTSYPLTPDNVAFIGSITILLFCVNTTLLSLASFRFVIKPVLILALLLSASAAYFMDTYNVIIDDVMLDNIVRTDHAEVTNLISLKQIIYIGMLGVLPAIAVWRMRLYPSTFFSALRGQLKLISVSVIVLLAVLFTFSSHYASFFREHKILRYYANPAYLIYSAGNYVSETLSVPASDNVTEIALDAKLAAPGRRRKLIVLVVGETTRADHMSLNGYTRNTNPLLHNSDVISFSNVWSCGTSTAVSLPCMFSSYSRDQYSYENGHATENLLDIAARVGLNVAWLDNNSDSKGVALRVPYQSFKSSQTNHVCDTECRDIGMLDYLAPYVDTHDSGDILLVLHQMGNHGPAYYKRYPSDFEVFTPACHTNILESCNDTEIINSYDNALAYTDYFLHETIARLKSYSADFDTAMIFIGDHGESLGEYGLYLHGLPYALAPDTQKHVPMIMWFDDSFKTDKPALARLATRAALPYSHDNIFHTLLGLTGITTSLYDKKLDITAP